MREGHILVKTRWRYILSSLLIALVCIAALTGIASVLYGDYSRNQIEEKFLARFNAAQLEADQQLEKLMDYGEQLSFSLVGMDPASGKSFDFQTNGLIAMLNNFSSGSEIPASPMVFVRSTPQWIYTSSGRISYAQFEEKMREENIDPELSVLYSRQLTATKPIIYSAYSNIDKLIIVIPLGNAWASYPAALILIMDTDVISDSFANIGDSASIYALDSLGQLALSSPADGYETLTPNILYSADMDGIQKRDVHGENMVFLRQPSSTGLITYVGAVPERVFYQGWYTLQRQLVIAVCTIGGFVILLSLLIGYMNYIPVRNAYRQITGKAASHNHDELEDIVNTVAATRKNIIEMEERQKESLSLLKRQFLLGLINGTIKTEEEVRSYTDSLTLNPSYSYWQALFLQYSDEQSEGEQEHLIRLLDQLHLEHTELLYTECLWENGIGLVAGFSTDAPTEEAAGSVARRIVQYLFQNGQDSVLLGAGSLETSPLSMGISFYRATAAVKTAQQEGRRGAVIWQEHALSPSRIFLDTTLLAEGITYGNAEVANAALNELLSRVRQSHERFPMVRLMCSDILNTIIRFSEKQNLSLNKVLLCSIAEFQSLDEFQQKTQDMITQLCNQASQMRMQESVRSRSQVIAFIAENYKRSDLSLRMVSEEMGMSMSKINMVLKENLECSFVQYISLLRLNEVKRLLRETDDPIQTIVRSVGYYDVSSFMRKFKQMEGMPPGQYRAQHRQ